MLARYFMYSQVYFHQVRRIYDIHLMDFLKEWLIGGKFSTDIEQHLCLTDNEVLSAMAASARDAAQPGHLHSVRILTRQHFKVIYQRNPTDVGINPEAGAAVMAHLSQRFGADRFRHDRYQQRGGIFDFPVRQHDGRIVSSLLASETLNRVPIISIDYVFSERTVIDEANRELREHLAEIIKPVTEG